MSDLLKNIDARTRLAGTNRLEMLLFTLGEDAHSGRRETFGINVFKVREVMRAPHITRAPDMAPGIEGMVSLRSQLTAVIDLARYVRIEASTPPGIMIVTEYNGRSQGFLVEGVNTILRLDWSSMRVPPEMLSAEMGGKVTAVTELPDGRIVMMLDVERVLADTTDIGADSCFQHVAPLDLAHCTVFLADDSSVARKQIERTLDTLQVRHISAVNGRQAWEILCRLADQCDSRKVPLRSMIQLIITDVEMPEMDGYMLTRKIKADERFAGIPVAMHSSLSSESNAQLGKANGVDLYIPKFEPRRLAEAVGRLLRQGHTA